MYPAAAPTVKSSDHRLPGHQQHSQHKSGRPVSSTGFCSVCNPEAASCTVMSATVAVAVWAIWAGGIPAYGWQLVSSFPCQV
jgi:hypothetical protein